jgi:hypothetical protein
MPESGRVVVAAPSSQEAAEYAAFELGLSYMLDPHFPAGAVFTVDIDRCWQLEHEWMTEHQPSNDDDRQAGGGRR